MAVGELLTGGQVPCHDGFMHVAALVRPSFLSFGCARLWKVSVTCRVGAGCSVDG